MRKKNKNNNENAQMQDMNTVQMDGANAAFAANVNFSGAILQDAEAMETLTEESGKKSKKAKKALAKKEKAKKKKEEYIEKKGLLGNADDYHVYHMKPVDTLTGYLMGVAAVAAGAYIFFYSIPFSIIAGAIAGFFSIKLYRKSLLKKRQRRLLLQFKDLLESINNSYAAGKNTPDAFLGAYNDLQMQYGETSDIVKEVAIINAGIQNNYNIEELLLDLGDRSGLEDITNFSDVFEVSNRLGGNLKQVVSESYDMIRDKIDIELEINTIVASGRNDLNALTFEWATVIAGWTVFGVPIVQTVLKIALALAESAYDLSQLCLGKSVPLYKSSTTWAMSPQGMIGIAKDAATELIENAAQAAGDKLDKLVTNIFDTIGNTANDKIKDLEGTVNNYIEQTKNSITDQVINATVTPFLNSVKGIVGKIDSNWGEEKIKEELNASLEKLKENSTDDIFGKCKTLAIEYLQGKVDKVTSTIYQNLSSTTENMANETMKQVKGLFYSENSTPGYIEELTEQLKAKVNELSSKLQENVTNALNSTEDNVKEKLNSALTDFTDKVSGTVSSGLDKVGEAAPDNNTVGDVTNAKAATISLNYKEYLYAFMLIGILANEDNMIARTGYLMQMNISQKMTDAGFDDSDRENFDMTKMYTMVQIHSEADVDSVFMGMFEKKTVNGEESYSLNFDGDGSSTDRLVYNGFIGY